MRCIKYLKDNGFSRGGVESSRIGKQLEVSRQCLHRENRRGRNDVIYEDGMVARSLCEFDVWNCLHIGSTARLSVAVSSLDERSGVANYAPVCALYFNRSLAIRQSRATVLVTRAPFSPHGILTIQLCRGERQM